MTNERLQKMGSLCVATVLGAGYFPLAPGTMGSLVGVALIWFLKSFSIGLMVVVILLLSGAGVWASQKAGQVFGVADSPHIVIDEVVGMLITMLAIPITLYWLAWGFIMFRVFDVFKPPPANFFDARMKNGWGVMLDDVFAGIYGNVLLHFMIRAQL